MERRRLPRLGRVNALAFLVMAALAGPGLLGAAGHAAGPRACPATRANGNPPPGQQRSAGIHGNGALWTALPPRGTLIAVPPPATLPLKAPSEVSSELDPDGSLSFKFPWWGAGRASGPLTITGRRLDGPAPPFEDSSGSGFSATRDFQASAITLPRAGCWQITGSAGEAHLTFVINVVDRVTDRRAVRRPVPGARTCRATRPNGAVPPGQKANAAFHGNAGLWTELRPRGIVLVVSPGRKLTREMVVQYPARAGERAPFMWVSFPFWRASPQSSGDLTLTVQRLDRQPRDAPFTGNVQEYGNGDPASTQIRFPAPGCYSVTAAASSARLRFVVLVVDARRNVSRGPPPRSQQTAQTEPPRSPSAAL